MLIEVIIDINQISKTYRGNASPALNDLTLSIRRGEIFGLLGPNGAGKSTLLNILCGLLTFDRGTVTVCGYPLPSRLDDIKPLIGVAPQDIALYPTLTGYENLKIFGGIYGMKGQPLEQRISEMLSFFGLEHSKNKRIDAYSGGMKRRINLIAGLLHRPEALFLDEPTVGIDVQSKTLILDNLKQINSEGTTIIYTSHYMEEAEQLCTRVAFIDEGRLLCEGAPAELLHEQGCTDGNLESLYLQLTGKKLRD
ncbi:MAG: ABC transporter ATP-binding protein [Tannerella sp.]|jgi:ABC-2 type transport system ATP-binding protein|nr:ABC transporter ATP-binding protein [Tannerella sp.]